MLVKIIRKIIPENIYLKLRLFLQFRFFRNEIELTQKYALQMSKGVKNDRITIVFIIWAEAMWNSLRSVYEQAEKDSHFDVYILAQPHISNRMGKENENPCFDFLSALYQNVISAYADGQWFDLTTLNPNYVFYTYPYSSEYYAYYNPAYVRKFAKVCLIQYGFNLVKNAIFDRAYNFLFSKNVAIHFVQCTTVCKKLNNYYGKIKGEYPKIENLGFPRFDLVSQTHSDFHEPCVLWTPRWTLPAERKYDTGSSFLAYYNDFLNFAATHKDISFIIRPHPLMFQNFLKKGFLTQTEIDDFRMRCKNLGNVIIDDNADYLKSIKKASIFIADFSSLIAEFFVTGKPVIFCAEGKDFIPEAKIMDSVLYHAKTWSDVERLLINLLAGKDDMKEARLSAIQNFLPQKSKTAADSILDCIYADYHGCLTEKTNGR